MGVAPLVLIDSYVPSSNGVATARCFLICCAFCGVLSRKLNRECVFVFGSKKTKRRWRFSFFYSTLKNKAAGYGAGPGVPIWPSDRCR
jgi:hypothetical protein